MSRAFQRIAMPAGAALLVALAAAPSAAAAPDDAPGLWYYTQPGLEQVHERTTGEGITIAMLDTAINPDVPELVGTGLEVHEPSYCAASEGGPALPATTTGPLAQHATSIASMLVGSGNGVDGQPGVRGVAPGAKLIAFANLSIAEDRACLATADQVGTRAAAVSFRDAVASGANIINVSATLDMDTDDYVAALREGVIVVGAAGNTGGIVTGWPATLNGAVAVGTARPDMTLDPGSPSGPELGVIAPGAEVRCLDGTFATYAYCTGSSQATAYVSGALALVWSAYPDATANQILQSLVRNTDGEAEHEPVHDESWGYGAVNVRLMLESDPTSYPDVNPFIRTGPDEIPSASALLAETAPEAPANPAPNSDAPSTDDPQEAGLPGGVITAVAVVVLLALVVAGVLLVRRRSATAPTHHAPSTDRGGHRG
ncbi:S8 family serine peptidase [Cellulomonas triticagri]|uniref:Peptidase S8/S53 domain-containing protein n=1 Tax=Cellulomonas triticagri TaxID=2483352 RepID=A0A3M2JMP5_9CELL|nr:S8 family serine peptidase [Cellulomonas triticagri]RMI13546.1 hypothetical protein EBM89_03805 [Cellulomonas triticagri]